MGSGRGRRARFGRFCSVALAVAAFAPAAGAATPAQIVARLNAERVANGIPGGVELNPAWTLGCRHHIRYEELNNIGWTHVETAGRPGYTADGRLAGLMGDQADTGSWDNGDPYENLPLHLANLLLPSLQQIGAYEDGRRSCIEVTMGYSRPLTSDALFSAPGPGRTAVPTSQTVHGEDPASPGQVVGLPQGTTTGPTIYLFATGPWTASPPIRLISARVTGPAGPVALRLVDPASHPAIARVVPIGVFFLIPVRPLAAGATYHVTATVAGRDDAMTKSWSFRTQ